MITVLSTYSARSFLEVEKFPINKNVRQLSTSNFGTKKLSKNSHGRGNMDANLPLLNVTNGGDSAIPARKKPEKEVEERGSVIRS